LLLPLAADCWDAAVLGTRNQSIVNGKSLLMKSLHLSPSLSLCEKPAIERSLSHGKMVDKVQKAIKKRMGAARERALHLSSKVFLFFFFLLVISFECEKLHAHGEKFRKGGSKRKPLRFLLLHIFQSINILCMQQRQSKHNGQKSSVKATCSVCL